LHPWLDGGEINTALAIAPAAFFCRQIFVDKPANVKYRRSKKYSYYNGLHIKSQI